MLQEKTLYHGVEGCPGSIIVNMSMSKDGKEDTAEAKKDLEPSKISSPTHLKKARGI